MNTNALETLATPDGAVAWSVTKAVWIRRVFRPGRFGMASFAVA